MLKRSIYSKASNKLFTEERIFPFRVMPTKGVVLVCPVSPLSETRIKEVITCHLDKCD